VKRSHDEAFPTDSELSLMSKPERKRYREKRRRDRVNASFDELRALLIRIDPQCSNRADISQLELIDRSITVINTLLDERSRNRELIRELEARQRERVLVSIP
jgi:Helix-loop-helix DNA-binding domain